MEHRLLFVDDERSLLNGIERRLGFDHDLDTAESGPEALNVIRENGPYAVVFTDMRMPHMDGLEFVEQARRIAPDSVFVMLTGNNDQETAVNAINKGRVFRFLNKPCDADELKAAIEDCVRQYELVRHEKELLQKTFVGAVRVLTDVVDAIQPELAGRGESIENRIDMLRDAAGIDDRWEFKLAGRLSVLGLALLPEADRLRFERSEPNANLAEKIRARTASTTSRLLRAIPRLEAVARICEQSKSTNGDLHRLHPKSTDDVAETGALLLRAAILWNDFARRGMSSEAAANEIKALMPGLPQVMCRQISSAPEDETNVETVIVGVEALEEGMVVGGDITTDEGHVLLRRSRRLSGVAIEKLQGYRNLRPIEITAASAGAVRQVVPAF